VMGIFALFGLVFSGSTTRTAGHLLSTLSKRSGSSTQLQPTSESGGIKTPQRAPSVGLTERDDYRPEHRGC